MAYILDPWAKTRENLSLHRLCGYTTSKSRYARREACKTRDGISTETWRFRLSVHSSRHWTASRNARDLQGKVLEKSLGQPFCASRWDNVLLLTVFLDPPPRGVVTACKEARAKNSNVYMYLLYFATWELYMYIFLVLLVWLFYFALHKTCCWVPLSDPVIVYLATSYCNTVRKICLFFLLPGLGVTVFALTSGLLSMRTGDKVKSQKMMRLRVGAQGFTVIALLCGVAYNGHQMRKEREMREQMQIAQASTEK